MDTSARKVDGELTIGEIMAMVMAQTHIPMLIQSNKGVVLGNCQKHNGFVTVKFACWPSRYLRLAQDLQKSEDSRMYIIRVK